MNKAYQETNFWKPIRFSKVKSNTFEDALFFRLNRRLQTGFRSSHCVALWNHEFLTFSSVLSKLWGFRLLSCEILINFSKMKTLFSLSDEIRWRIMFYRGVHLSLWLNIKTSMKFFICMHNLHFVYVEDIFL